MALPTPDSFIKPFSNCLKTNFDTLGFDFPEIGKPGMPPILLGSVGAMLAPAIKILDFIPPTADIVVDLQDLLTNLPKIVIDGFTGSAIGLPILNFNIFGINVKVGDITIPETNFNSDSIINFIKALIQIPFDIFTGILESLIKLSPKFPNLDFILDLLTKGLQSIGIPIELLKGFAKCLASVFMSIIDSIKP